MKENHPIKKMNDIQLLVLGDKSVGKTSIVNQYIHGNFNEIYQPTIGNHIEKFVAEIPEKGEKNVIINDTGNMDNLSLQKLISACQCVILVFDLRRIESFHYVVQIQKNVMHKPHVIVGNKRDLPRDLGITNEIQQFNINSPAKYLECSATEGDSVDEVFNCAIDASFSTGNTNVDQENITNQLNVSQPENKKDNKEKENIPNETEDIETNNNCCNVL